MFELVVKDFGVEHIGESNAKYIIHTLRQHWDITKNWKGDKFLGIDFEWNYNDHTSRMSMKKYIQQLLLRFHHQTPSKPCHAPHVHQVTTYGTKVQHEPAPDQTPTLNSEQIKWMQAIVRVLLYYARAVDNKLLVSLGTIAAQTHTPTKFTANEIYHLMDYVAPYPNDRITLRKIEIQLAAHSDACFLNEKG